MPLGIVDDKEFQKELEKINGSVVPKENNEKPKEQPIPEVKTIERGRGLGSTEVPTSLQKLIGETHLTEGRSSALKVAEFLGISKSSESAYAKGATSTASYNKLDEDLTQHLNKKKAEITSKASSKLHSALDKIDDDKLDDLDAKELASIAKDMSVIVKNFEPESPKTNSGNTPTIVFYAPKISSEDKFDVITVNE